MNRLLSILALVFVLFSCDTHHDNRKVVAQVYEDKLYNDEVLSYLPKGINSQDSTMMRNEFIDQWVRHHVLLHKALENNTQNEREIAQLQQQVEEYKNSLVIYRFTKRMVEQKLDTVVQYKEIKDYYDKHKKEFTLKDDIVQVSFVKFPLNSKNIKPVRKLFKKYKPEDLPRIKAIAQEKAVNYFLDDNTWILFDELKKEVPIKTYNRSLYLKNNKYIEVNDSLFTYMLRINNFRVQDNVSPLSFEYDNIRRLIINMRKMKLIDRMKEHVFQEAQKQGVIHIEN